MHAANGYRRLLDIDGWALLLGVDIHRLSSMHQAEGLVGLPDEIIALFRAPEDVYRDYPEDQWYIQYGEAPEDAWGKVQAEAEQCGLIRHKRIGQANCMLFKARAMVDLYADALRCNPYQLYGLKKPVQS